MIGEHLGSYRITGELGRGGMATVYRAWQESTTRSVAIKVVHPKYVDSAESLVRFRREARLIARLEHPHLVPVYDFDGSNDPPYLVMRYVEGDTLKGIVARGPIPLADLGLLLKQIASALDYAHRCQVVHRDLKPSNILVDLDGNAFVTDFGVARLVGPSSGITATGAMLGTPEYISPEQATGSASVDLRADVYSLGVMLFEGVSGRRPFTGSSPISIVLAHINDAPPDLHELVEECPEAIASVIAKAMAKAPDDRYQNVDALTRAFIEALPSGIASAPEHLRTAARSSIDERRTEKKQEETLTRGFDEATLVERLTPDGRDQTISYASINRHLTVLYVNLAEAVEEISLRDQDSPELSARELVETLVELIERAGGRLHQRTDSTLLALWGVERSNEHDTAEALRCALGLREATLRAVGEHLDPAPLQIALASGPVLVSRKPGGSSTASGPCLTFVNRLERAAPVGSVVIPHLLYRRVRGLFTMTQGDPLRGRHRREPVQTYLVSYEKSRAFASSIRGVEGVETRMVGRRGELELIRELFDSSIEDREAQVILLIAEAGLGKTRLLEELNQQLDLDEMQVLFFRGVAAPGQRDRPFALIRDLLCFRFQIQDSDDHQTVLGKLESGIADLIGEQGAVGLAASLAAIAGFDVAATLGKNRDESPARRSQRTARELGRLLVGACKRYPVLIEIDDAHLADRESLEALMTVVVECPELPLVIIYSARPELLAVNPGWTQSNSLTHIDLRPLSRRDSRRLVVEILKRIDKTPEALRDLIVERSEGNPWFIEELVKVLIDEKVIITGEPWRVELERLRGLGIPDTVTGLVQARLDGLLPDEQLVMQRASVVGRIFWAGALQAIDDEEGGSIDIDDALARLASSELVVRRPDSAFSGSKEFAFSSSLVRDVVLASLPASIHTSCHRLVAQWLEAAAGDRAAEHAELIAEHYTLGAMEVAAARHLGQAGRQALRMCAPQRARELLEEALNGAAAEDRGEIEIAAGEAYRRLGDYGEAERHLRAALTADPALSASAWCDLGMVEIARGSLDTARPLLVDALDRARADNNDSVQAHALFGLGEAAWRRGYDAEARAHLEHSLELVRRSEDTSGILHVLNRLGSIALHEGDDESAAALFVECRDLASASGDRDRLAAALGNLGVLKRLEGDYEAAHQLFSESLELAIETAESRLRLMNLLNLGATASELGRLDEAKTHLLEVLRRGMEARSVFILLAGLTAWAGLEAARGERESALPLLGLVLNHEACDSDIRMESGLVLRALEANQDEARRAAGALPSEDLVDVTSQLLETNS